MTIHLAIQSELLILTIYIYHCIRLTWTPGSAIDTSHLIHPTMKDH